MKAIPQPVIEQQSFDQPLKGNQIQVEELEILRKRCASQEAQVKFPSAEIIFGR